MSIQLRDAVPADAESIARLHVAAWRVGYRGVLPDALLDGLDLAAWTERRRGHLEHPAAGIHNTVAVDGDEILGWGSRGPSRDDDDDPQRVGEIYGIYVDPDRWGAGVGRALVDHCLEDLHRQGYEQATLWVLEENPRARGLYEAAGMAVDGGRKPCGVKGITSPSVRYRRRLRGEDAVEDPDARWVEVALLSDLEGGMKSVSADGLSLLVGRAEGGALFAVDDRCPHEGYPLRQGVLKDCVLTCAWHNWKFDVRDGANLLGGEGVPAWPVRLRGDAVEVDVRRPPPEVAVPRLLASLRDGLRDGALDRCLRDAGRLLVAGLSSRRLLVEIARDDARRGEYGTTHTLPVCGDLAEIVPPSGLDALPLLAPALAVCIEGNRRLPLRPRSEPVARGDRAALLRIVEQENVDLAEAVVRGLARKEHPDLEDWLLTATSRHFTDFGHSLIFLVRMRPLSHALDDEGRADLWGAFAVHLAQATREDTLPYMRRYMRSLEARVDDLPRLAGLTDADAPFDDGPFRHAVLDGTATEACDALWAALEAGVSAPRVARALVLAAASRLLRFDLRVEFDDDVAESWLWATHRFTFASAVREAVDAWTDPDALRFLLQAVAFVHSGRGMDCAPEDRPRVGRTVGPAQALRDALSGRRPDEAMARARAAAWSPEERRALLDPGLGDRFVRPVFAAHGLKTAAAALREHDALGEHPDRWLPVVAAARFLASAVIEDRRVGAARRAMAFVQNGKPVRKLTQ